MFRRILPIILLTFVNVIGFSLLIPVLPFVVEQYHGNAFTFGLLLATYPAFQFLASPVLGSLSDRFGRRPILILSQTGTLLSWVVFGLAYFVPDISLGRIALPLWMIAFSRIVDGITGGNISVANAYLADITRPQERTHAYGILGAVFGIGFIIGPVLGGWTANGDWGFLGTVILAATISLVTLIIMILRLPESLKHKQKTWHFAWSDELNGFKRITEYRDHPFLRHFLTLNFFLAFTFSGYTSILVLFIKDKFSLSPGQIGQLFLIIGLYLIVNQGLLVKRISHRIGNLRTFLIGQGLMILGLIGLLFVHNLVVFLLDAYIINLGFSLSFPTFKAVINNVVPPAEQGKINGVAESINSINAAIAPLLAGWLYLHWQRFTFSVFAVFMLLPYVYYLLRFPMLNQAYQATRRQK